MVLNKFKIKKFTLIKKKGKEILIQNNDKQKILNYYI